MSKKLTALLLGAAISALAASAGAAAADAAYKAPLNAYGQPDLEGTWTNATLTTLERPKEYGTRKVMTAEEVKKIEGDDAKMYAADAAPRDPKREDHGSAARVRQRFQRRGLRLQRRVDRSGQYHHAGQRRAANLVYHGSRRTGGCRRTSRASRFPTCICVRTMARTPRIKRWQSAV